MHGREIEKTQDKEDDKKEINFLKKCNRQIFILKVIAIVLALFIVLVWSYKCIKCIYQYRNGKLVYNIISQVYQNSQNFKENNNFEFSVINKNLGEKWTYSYKDGKFKETLILPDNILGCTLTYGKINNGNILRINIWDYLKIVDSTLIPSIGIEDKEYIFQGKSAFEYLDRLRKKDVMNCGKINIAEESYLGTDCYILKEYTDGISYSLAIEKETMLIIEYKEIQLNGNTSTTNYSYQTGTLLDDALNIINLEGYEIDSKTQNYLMNF